MCCCKWRYTADWLKKQAASTFKVCEGIADKLIRRHPHVFGTSDVNDADGVVQQWEKIKQSEKGLTNNTNADAPESILSNVSKHQPALSRALGISQRAVKAGFAWPDLESLWACVMSEYDEFRVETDNLLDKEAPKPTAAQFDRLESEMGDILFATVNLARHFNIDPEVALTLATAKFIRRFQKMEQLLLAEAPLDQRDASAFSTQMASLDFAAWDALWNRAKTQCDEPSSTL